MSKKQILFIVGSLRRESFNLSLAQQAQALIGDRADVTYLDYADVPFMNQDLEASPPASIIRIRKAVANADAVWIFTPEYNRSYPGHLKNVIDWLSRPHDDRDKDSLEITGKKFALSGAGGNVETAKSREKLTELLEFVGAKVMAEHQTGIALNMEAWTEGRMILTEEQKKALTKQVDAFLACI